MTVIITANPDPPVKGQMCEFCLPGGGILEITFTPPGTSTQYPVTEESPCISVEVPANAGTVIAHDVSGETDDYTSPCKDP